MNLKYKISDNWLQVWREDQKDGISWDELQAVKNAAFGEDKTAVEIYPPQSEVVNFTNTRHLWLVSDTQDLPNLRNILKDKGIPVDAKILNVGMPRTGTFSLMMALYKLGYSSIHYPVSIEKIKPYDSACEVRFPIQELELKFPESKYILTRRNKEDWLKSCKSHISKRVEGWNPFWWQPEEAWHDYYQAWEKEVIDTLPADRLLLLDLEAENKWELLCNFLGNPCLIVSILDTNYHQGI